MGIVEKSCPMWWWCPGVSMGMAPAWGYGVPRMELVPREWGRAQGMGSCLGDRDMFRERFVSRDKG